MHKLVMLAIFVILLGCSDNDIDATDKAYCFNVGLWKASNGQAGWPDFNSNYDLICK